MEYGYTKFDTIDPIVLLLKKNNVPEEDIKTYVVLLSARDALSKAVGKYSPEVMQIKEAILKYEDHLFRKARQDEYNRLESLFDERTDSPFPLFNTINYYTSSVGNKLPPRIFASMLESFICAKGDYHETFR